MLLVVSVDDGQIEIPDVASHTLEPHHLDIVDAKNEEMGLRYIDEARFSRLQQHIRSESCTIKTQISIRNLKLKLLIRELFTSLCPCQKFPVDFALHVLLVLFVVGIFPAAADHIFSNDTTLRVKLNILCFFLTD